jgi:hypothetical protein
LSASLIPVPLQRILATPSSPPREPGLRLGQGEMTLADEVSSTLFRLLRDQRCSCIVLDVLQACVGFSHYQVREVSGTAIWNYWRDRNQRHRND